MGNGTIIMYIILLISLSLIKYKSPTLPEAGSKVLMISTWISILAFILLLFLVASFLYFFSNNQTYIFIAVLETFDVIAGCILPLNFIWGLQNLKDFVVKSVTDQISDFRNFCQLTLLSSNRIYDVNE